MFSRVPQRNHNQSTHRSAADLQQSRENNVPLSAVAPSSIRNLMEDVTHEVLKSLPAKRNEEAAKKSLKKVNRKSLKKLKDSIEMTRKLKMRTVQQYLCDNCDEIIPVAADGEWSTGFIVQGNVYAADPSSRGGLIGNNFPEVMQGEMIDPAAIRETVLCVNCFVQALGINPTDLPVTLKKTTKKAPKTLVNSKKAKESIADEIRAALNDTHYRGELTNPPIRGSNRTRLEDDDDNGPPLSYG